MDGYWVRIWDINNITCSAFFKFLYFSQMTAFRAKRGSGIFYFDQKTNLNLRV